SADDLGPRAERTLLGEARERGERLLHAPRLERRLGAREGVAIVDDLARVRTTPRRAFVIGRERERAIGRFDGLGGRAPLEAPHADFGLAIRREDVLGGDR